MLVRVTNLYKMSTRYTTSTQKIIFAGKSKLRISPSTAFTPYGENEVAEPDIDLHQALRVVDSFTLARTKSTERKSAFARIKQLFAIGS
jgi:hypothetical protein